MTPDITPSAQGPYSEAIRALRARILKPIRQGTRKILFTSAWPQEGKTRTLLALGQSLGEFGLRALLVDGDLRTSSLSLRCGFPKPDRDWNFQVFCWKEIFFCPIGAHTLLPEDVIAHPRMRQWFVEKASHFDVILVDSPSLSRCSDGLLWAQLCQAALMVSKKSRFQGIPEGNFCEDLRDQGCQVLGVVLCR